MTYTYKCSKCKHIQEVKHGMLEQPEIICKECGNLITEKIIVYPPRTMKLSPWKNRYNG
jgi:putative FmdB family regulatory protein